jgi:hypothetical protein
MTIKELFEVDENLFTACFSNFRHEFLDTWDMKLVSEEPVWRDSCKDSLIFAAAWVHFVTSILCKKIPEWCMDEKYIHPAAVWEGGTPCEYVALLTPPQLKHHNLYYRGFGLLSA